MASSAVLTRHLLLSKHYPSLHVDLVRFCTRTHPPSSPGAQASLPRRAFHILDEGQDRSKGLFGSLSIFSTDSSALHALWKMHKVSLLFCCEYFFFRQMIICVRMQAKPQQKLVMVDIDLSASLGSLSGQPPALTFEVRPPPPLARSFRLLFSSASPCC
jgi:hypothetical protein